MEVILLERLENLGDLGERVNVKSGYARNFLIPKRKANGSPSSRRAGPTWKRLPRSCESKRRRVPISWKGCG